MSFQILTWKHALNFHFYETESQIETHFKRKIGSKISKRTSFNATRKIFPLKIILCKSSCQKFQKRDIFKKDDLGEAGAEPTEATSSLIKSTIWSPIGDVDLRLFIYFYFFLKMTIKKLNCA